MFAIVHRLEAQPECKCYCFDGWLLLHRAPVLCLCTNNSKNRQLYYRNYTRQYFANWNTESDPEVLKQLHQKARQDASWVLQKVCLLVLLDLVARHSIPDSFQSLEVVVSVSMYGAAVAPVRVCARPKWGSVVFRVHFACSPLVCTVAVACWEAQKSSSVLTHACCPGPLVLHDFPSVLQYSKPSS